MRFYYKQNIFVSNPLDLNLSVTIVYKKKRFNVSLFYDNIVCASHIYIMKLYIYIYSVRK